MRVVVSIEDFSPFGIGLTSDVFLERGQQFTMQLSPSTVRSPSCSTASHTASPCPMGDFVCAEFVCIAGHDEASKAAIMPQADVSIDRVRARPFSDSRPLRPKDFFLYHRDCIGHPHHSRRTVISSSSSAAGHTRCKIDLGRTGFQRRIRRAASNDVSKPIAPDQHPFGRGITWLAGAAASPDVETLKLAL